jgi:hypothetical protein
LAGNILQHFSVAGQFHEHQQALDWLAFGL